MRTTQLIKGFGAQPYTMWLEQSADASEVQASYVEFTRLLKELTYTTREAEVVDGVVIPEETDIDLGAWRRYADLLVQWVSEQTGLAHAQLDDAMHPDVYEPYIRYRSSPLPASAPPPAYARIVVQLTDGDRQVMSTIAGEEGFPYRRAQLISRGGVKSIGHDGKEEVPA